jgi:hypothetical protein
MKRSRIFTAFKSHSSGQIAALLVVGSVGILTVMVGAAALVTDMGSYYYNYFRLQSAIDAAVLSGAEALPCNGSQASSKANSIAQADGVKSGELSGQPVLSGTSSCASGTGPNTIKMTVTRTVPFYFGRAVGVTQGTVNVSATAIVGQAGSVNNPFSFGLQTCLPGSTNHACPYALGTPLGTIVTVSTSGGGGWTMAPGNWGAVLVTGTVTVGSSISAQPGKGVDNTLFSILSADYSSGVSNYPSDTVNSITPGDPRVIVVPLVDWTGCNGACGLTVLGFADLWISAVDTKNQTISAQFVSSSVDGQITTGTTEDVGSVVVRLTS